MKFSFSNTFPLDGFKYWEWRLDDDDDDDMAEKFKNAGKIELNLMATNVSVGSEETGRCSRVFVHSPSNVLQLLSLRQSPSHLSYTKLITKLLSLQPSSS